MIGISVYPEFTSFPELEKYVSLAAELGFSQVFMSLILSDLNFEGAAPPDAPVFEKAFALCGDKGMIITADINDRVFDYFGGTAAALSRLKSRGIGTLRIDSGLSPEELAALAGLCADQGMELEINVSGLIPELTRRAPAGRGSPPEKSGSLEDQFFALIEKNQKTLVRGGFNFYPRRGTGLALSQLRKVTSYLAGRGIECSAFVGSLVSPSNLHGPGRGVCTVEEHRESPPEIAGAVLFYEGISRVYVGDPTASPEELKSLAGCLSGGPLRIPVVYYRECPAAVRKELAGRILTNRADVPLSVIRGTQARGIRVPPFRCCSAEPLALTMDNENSGQYAGEVQIVLEAQGPNNAVNVLGFVHPDAAPLIPCLAGGAPFVLYDYYGGHDA